MKIGKLQIIFDKDTNFLCIKGCCGCIVLGLPLLTIIWQHDDCKCEMCQKHECTCMADE